MWQSLIDILNILLGTYSNIVCIILFFHESFTILGFISLFTKLVINHECCIVNAHVIYFTPIYSVYQLIVSNGI